MIDNYHIEEMVLQSQQVVVYRMVDDAGREYALSRFILPKDVLIALNDGRFPQCLKELMGISHGCLRPVIDGGLDPVDRSPWLATYWWEGKPLQDRLQDKELSVNDVHRVEEHAKSVMSGVGQFASFLNFDPGKIVAVQGASGDVVETFTIDLYQWFLSWATGRPPAPEREPNRQLAGLLSHIRKNVAMPVPRASSTILPPPKTTSMNSGVMPVAGPITGVIRPVGTSSVVGTVQHSAHQAPPAANVDPLAAYRKKATKGQKAGVTAAVFFIIAAVAGIGWVVMQDSDPFSPAAVSDPEKNAESNSPASTSPRKEVSILDKLSNQRKLEQAQAQSKSQSASETPVAKAMIIEEGDGAIIEGEAVETPSPSQQTGSSEETVAKALPLDSTTSPGERPPFEEMVELFSSKQVNLKSISGRWVILTGKVQTKRAGVIKFDGPSALNVHFTPAVTHQAEVGDTVEIIGWVDPQTQSSSIFMEKSEDLEILEKGTGEQKAFTIYGVDDRQQLRDRVGNTVTVVARVIALSDDKGANDGEVRRLYLVFAEDNAGFAASVELSEREDDIDLAYLEQFVGEKVQVQGEILIQQSSPALRLKIRSKNQIIRSKG